MLSVLPGANVHMYTFVGGPFYSDANVIVDGFGCTPTTWMHFVFGIGTETAVDPAFRCDWATRDGAWVRLAIRGLRA